MYKYDTNMRIVLLIQSDQMLTLMRLKDTSQPRMVEV